jgi:hypothetical protein
MTTTLKKDDELILSDEDKKQLAAAYIVSLLAVIEDEWLNLPLQIRGALENAVLSGFAEGANQVGADAKLLASAKEVAERYAAERSGELIGMTRGPDGEWIPNPAAEMAISRTTEERVRAIVAEAFDKGKTLGEVTGLLQEALAEEATGSGIFSDARSRLISETEISMAQTFGNFNAWTASGAVRQIRWITTLDEKTCGPCAENDGEVRKIGELFPSGDVHPGLHPHCRCAIEIVE